MRGVQHEGWVPIAHRIIVMIADRYLPRGTDTTIAPIFVPHAYMVTIYHGVQEII